MTARGDASRSGRSAWLLLIAAAAALAFANGRWYLPFAAWLAPLLVVLFLDTQPARRGLIAAFVAQLLAFFINWQGMIPVPGVWYYVIAGTYAVIYFIPFVVHRLLVPRLTGFAGTLVLPAAWVSTEFLVQQFVTPYGSWVSLAYTQVEQLWVLQLASVTGLAGISFLMLWTASVVGWAWKNRGTPTLTRAGRIVIALVLLTVLIWGQYRLSGAPTAGDAMRVAGITPSGELTRSLQSESARVQSADSADSVSLARLEELADAVNQDLLRRSHLEAAAGADVVVWSEHAARVMADAESELLTEAADLAREWQIALIAGVGVWHPNGTPPYENKAVLIRPDGTIASHYGKARPIAGSESSLINEGGSGIAVLASDDGRIGTVICHDLDFPDFIRAAGQEEVEILVAPSADWDEITPFHAHMAIARAVENGCFLFRPCANGLSLAVDPFGRQIAAVRDDGTAGSVIVASLSNYRVPTAYSRAGNFFAYGSLIVLLALVVIALAGRRAGRVTLSVSLLAVMIAMGTPARASDGHLQPFRIKDQFDDVHTEAELLGRVTLVFASDRKGSAYNGRWLKALRDSLAGMGRLDSVRIVEVATLRGVPFFIKGTVKGKFTKDKNKRVLMDWKGWFAKTYAFEKDACTIALFDADGTLIRRAHGQELEDEELGALTRDLRTLLRSP